MRSRLIIIITIWSSLFPSIFVSILFIIRTRARIRIRAEDKMKARAKLKAKAGESGGFVSKRILSKNLRDISPRGKRKSSQVNQVSVSTVGGNFSS